MITNPPHGPRSPEVDLAPGVTREFLHHHEVCPKAYRDDGTLILAVAPDALDCQADLERAYQAPIVSEPCSKDSVERLIERLVNRAGREVELARVDLGEDMTADVRSLANEPPVIRYVNLLIRDAYDAGASDIHFEAKRDGVVVRFRIDGVLGPAPEPPHDIAVAVVSRLKLLAELDVSEKRRPQDGRIRVRLDTQELDLRIATVPTMFGESVVVRLLDHGGRPADLEALGFSVAQLDSMDLLCRRPHGLLLVTGPTGSGKTTTLYAALQRRRHDEEKIITVEDPVEYQLDGITQVPVQRAAGVTFATALRSILRQDPDVVMVGEMRDLETCEIAVQAAMTGHLVFSTLHTNDAVGAVPRLVDLGVPDYLVAATLEAVLAQRLVRRICDQCRTTYTPAPEAVAALSGRPSGSTRLERGAGCPACRGTGFHGRVGLFELLQVTDAVRDAVTHGRSRGELRDVAVQEGMVGLRQDGWAKVEAGLTTVEEVLRVAQA